MNRRDVLKSFALLPFTGLLPQSTERRCVIGIDPAEDDSGGHCGYCYGGKPSIINPEDKESYACDTPILNKYKPYEITVSWTPSDEPCQLKYFHNIKFPEEIIIEVIYNDKSYIQIQHFAALVKTKQQAQDFMRKITILEVSNVLNNNSEFTVGGITFKSCWMNTYDTTPQHKH